MTSLSSDQPTSNRPDSNQPDFDVDVRAPLPVELGDLTPTVEWWLTANNAPDARTAPRAKLDSTITLHVLESPELRPIAAAICGLLTNHGAAEVTADVLTDDGLLDHAAWMRDCALIRDDMSRLRPLRNQPADLHAAIPPPMQRLADLLRTDAAGAIVVDGPVATACLLLARELNPDCLARVRPLQNGRTATESLSWEYLRLVPILPMTTGFSHGELIDLGIALINRGLDLAAVNDDQAVSND